jgi:hypothetical protein
MNNTEYIEISFDNYRLSFDIITDSEADIGNIYNSLSSRIISKELMENIIIYQLKYNINQELYTNIEQNILKDKLDINNIILSSLTNNNYTFLKLCINSKTFKLDTFDILLQLSKQYLHCYFNKYYIIKECFNKLFNIKNLDKDQIDKLFYNSLIHSNMYIFEKLLRYYNIYNQFNILYILKKIKAYKLFDIFIRKIKNIEFNNPLYFQYYIKKYYILRSLIRNKKLNNITICHIFNMIKDSYYYNRIKKILFKSNIIPFDYQTCDLLYKTRAYEALNLYLINNYHIHNIQFATIKEKYNNIIYAGYFYSLLVKLKINNDDGNYIYRTVYKKYRWRSHTIKFILKNIKNLLCF